jgi:hypothetical protein
MELHAVQFESESLAQSTGCDVIEFALRQYNFILKLVTAKLKPSIIHSIKDSEL